MFTNEDIALTDMHCHILYGVDDGAKDLETAVSMLRIAHKEGVRKIILTPHFKPHHHILPETLKDHFDKLKQIISDENLDISLYPGGEALYFGGMERYLEEGKIPTMAGGRYVLVEFLPADDCTHIKNALYELLSAGYLPILAHVERYECMLKHPGYAKDLKNMGAYLQINTGSVNGVFGHDAKKYTRTLLKEDLVSFVASDAHDTKKRAPLFKKCVSYMIKHVGSNTTKKIMEENPLKVMEDEII